MAALARALGQGRPAALVAGLTYAGSGWILSGLTFYNLLAVSAWWPLVLLGAVRGGRKGIALGGLACGLALLAGEPVTAALGIVPLLLVAIQRHGPRRGFLTSSGIGLAGLLIALPQIVATARILGFTSRGALGAADIGGGRFHLGLARLLELIVPFPFGHPWDLGKAGYWPWDDQPGLPYILTLHLGIVGLWLALAGARRARRLGGARARRARPRLGRRARRRRPGGALPRADALPREAPLLVRARRLPARRLGARRGARDGRGPGREPPSGRLSRWPPRWASS